MKHRIPLALAALALVAGPTSLVAQRPTLSANTRRVVSIDTSVVAITNVTLVDGTGAPAQRGQTIVIRDGRIESVGPSAGTRPPQGALVVDGTGHTVIPGLVGLHDHLYYQAAGGRSMQMSFTGPRLYLAAGVTTIRTTGSASPYADINLKRAVDAGDVPGPRIFVTTPYLTGEGGGGTMSVARTPEDARRFVAYWAEEGASWIKFYTNITRENMRAAIDEAHRRGMKTTGHLCSVTFREAVELGIDDLSHGALTATDFHPRKQPDRCPSDNSAVLDTHVTADGPIARDLIALMVRRNVSMTTTMPVFELFYPRRPVTEERILSLMAPDVRVSYLASRAFLDTARTNLTEAGFQRALAFDRAFYAAGGILANGVDPTGNGGALPGLGDQRGFELLRESGMSTEDAVKVCTLNGARILGLGERLGSIERGKTADLVLLRGDLTLDPLVIRQVVTVFKDGVGYDSPRMIELVRGRVGIN